MKMLPLKSLGKNTDFKALWILESWLHGLTLYIDLHNVKLHMHYEISNNSSAGGFMYV